MKEKKADIALAGLGVMGANLARNMKNKGFSVAVYDLEEEKIQALEAEGFLEAYWEEAAGRKRKYYHITQKGLRSLAEKKEEWAVFSGAVQKVLHYAGA